MVNSTKNGNYITDEFARFSFPTSSNSIGMKIFPGKGCTLYDFPSAILANTADAKSHII